MKRLRLLGMAAFAALLMSGCAAVAHVEKDDTVNFSSYKSFAWVSAKNDSTQAPVSELVERNIRNTVNAELAKQGWREAKNKPDILLSYDVLVEKNVKNSRDAVYSQPYTRPFYNPYTRRWGTIYYPSQFMGYDDNQYEVREGTVTITMIDAKTDKMVWQGWTTDEVSSRNITSKEIQNSIKAIFRKFDVAKK